MKKEILFLLALAIMFVFIKKNNNKSTEVYVKESVAPVENSSISKFDGCNSMNIGSAKSLGSNTFVLITYVSYEDEPNISASEKTRFVEAYKSATDWIKKEAYSCGKKQTFVTAYYNNGSDIKVSHNYDIKVDSPNKLMYNKLGSNSTSQLRKMANEHNCDSYIVIICTDKKGVCQAYKDNEKHYNEIGRIEYLEGCVINTHVGGYLDTSIAHEIMHCYGAWDLYGDIYKSHNNTLYLKEELATSIMTDTFIPLSKVKVDDLTKYITGLSTVRYDWFNELAKNGAY